LTQPVTWLLPALLLLASTVDAQPQPPARQRQDRRVALPTTSEEPAPEVRVAVGNLTTLVFNAPLDRDTLEVDRTRFKLADMGEHSLNLEPATELGSGERLVVKVRFKDRALPSQAIIALVSHAIEMDGRVEVDRRANTPEALLAALAQKEAELEELTTRCSGSGPVGLMLAGWLNEASGPVTLVTEGRYVESHGLRVQGALGFKGQSSALLGVPLRNLPSQKPLALGQVRITDATGAPVKVLTVQLKPEHVAPGEEGLVVVEAQTPPWKADKPFTVELVGVSGQRRITFTLKKR
jgi:uncharacterized protein (TIGR02268 family)